MKTQQILTTVIASFVLAFSINTVDAQSAIDSSKTPKNQIVQVVFIDFTAYSDVKGNMIEWATILEANLDKFIIQRSIDNLPFETIGEIKGRGIHGAVTQYYSFTDDKPQKGKNIYRLLMADIHGNYKISETKSVSWTALIELNNGFHTYPNPAKPGDNVKINVEEKGQYAVQFFSLSGKQVINTIVNGGGSSAFSVQIPSMLGKGFYIVRLTRADTKEMFQQKIMVL